MPRGDGTGPMGIGPMTGRVGGFCSGSTTPGSTNAPAGRGFGAGFGAGSGRNCPAWGQGQGSGGGRRGRRNMLQVNGIPSRMNYAGAGPQAQENLEMEKNFLENKAKALQSEIDLVKGRLAALTPDSAAE